MARPRTQAKATMVKSKDRATSSVAARRAVLKRIKDEGVEHVLFWFTDLEGHLKSFAITPVRDGGGAERRDGLRRLVDHRLQRDRGVGHGRDPRSRELPAHAAAARRARAPDRRERRAHDLRRRHARRRAVRGRPALRPAQGARPHEEHGLRRVQRRPRARVLPVRGRQGHRDARRGRLLRDDRPGRGHRGTQRHDPRARGGRHPDRVPPPRGRALAARDRHALRGRARDGRLHDHVPADREGGRRLARLLRDLHAEAALRRERLGHAHAHVALQGRPQPVLRPARRAPPLEGREELHRRPARARARDVRGPRAVGELVQAARARLRGARVRRLVAAQPLGAHPDPAVQAGLRAGDPRGDPLPGSGVQPVPRVRRAAPCGPRGDREGLRAPRSDGAEPLPAHRDRAARAGIVSLPSRSARRSTSSPARI